MSFVHTDFLWLFVATLTLYWALPSRRAQNVLLLVASAVFYGWVHPWFVLILFGSATVDYLVGRGMGAWPQHRRKLLALSLATNLGLLGFFKYVDFFLENVAALVRGLGLGFSVQTLGVLLPVGISFYTFQTLSYTLDCYRGTVRPRRSLIDYLAYVTFFTQLVAGPIERATRLLPQMERPRRLRLDALRSGFGLALFGVFKKVVIADTLAPYVDEIFMLQQPSGPLLWAGAASFGVQLYADFSGYTDIARGTARMLGFDLSRNFDRPFLATSTPDFWRRWHQSLSSWIRDYLLVPLLGRQEPVAPSRVAAAIVVTFLLIGLWHGAGWNFVLFGAWHAMWVLLYLAMTPRVPHAVKALPGATVVAVLLHTVLVQIPGALLFREPRASRLPGVFLERPWSGTTEEWQLAVVVISLAVLLSLPMVAEVAWERLRERLQDGRARRWILPLQTTGWAAMMLGVAVFYRVAGRDFVYFAF